MKNWVKLTVFVALVLTLTGAYVSGEKNALILPAEPKEDIIINLDIDWN